MKNVILATLLIIISFTFATSPKWRLIEMNNQKLWVTEEQIAAIIRNHPSRHVPFVDITDTQELNAKALIHANFPEKPTRQHIVKPFLSRVEAESKKNIEATLKHLSSYRTRHATTQTGVEAAEWLLSQYQKIINALPADRKGLFSVSLFKHQTTRYIQPSVIARIQGKSDEIVVLGCHEDSTSSTGVAPGADDNGTGSSSVLEVFRLLAQSNYVPNKTIEFHSYAAEEMGLLGSADIVAHYKRENKKVYAMMQIDMNGYNPNENKIGLITNGVSPTLTDFVAKLITEYLKIGYVKKSLIGGSSDHYSWTRGGYHSCFPFESKMNPHIHTPRDTIDKLDLDIIPEWVKLGIGFIVELGN